MKVWQKSYVKFYFRGMTLKIKKSKFWTLVTFAPGVNTFSAYLSCRRSHPKANFELWCALYWGWLTSELLVASPRPFYTRTSSVCKYKLLCSWPFDFVIHVWLSHFAEPLVSLLVQILDRPGLQQILVMSDMESQDLQMKRNQKMRKKKKI